MRADYEVKEFKSIFTLTEVLCVDSLKLKCLWVQVAILKKFWNFESCGQECLKGERTKGLFIFSTAASDGGETLV